MTVEQLMRLIESADWFAKPGAAKPAPSLVPMSVADWRRYMQGAVNAEFNLPNDVEPLENDLIEDMTWLPSGNDEADPIHGNELVEAAHSMNLQGDLQAARMKAFRVALASQRRFPDNPILMVGPTDSNNAARSAGRFACRMAASEVIVGSVGFWCEVVMLYHQGHWPLGRSSNGNVVVL